MRKCKRSERGAAALEFALFIPLFTALMLLAVEGANAMHTYSSMIEASREGARMVLMQGNTNNVADAVQSLATGLDGTRLETRVLTDTTQKTVTVEVDYEYESFYGENSALEMLNDNQPLVFSARTVMPMP